MDAQIDVLKKSSELSVFTSECDTDQIAGDILARDGIDGSADNERDRLRKYSDAYVQKLNTSIRETEACIVGYIMRNSAECIARMQLVEQSEESVRSLHEKVKKFCCALEITEKNLLIEKETLRHYLEQYKKIKSRNDLAQNVLRFKELSDCIEREARVMDITDAKVEFSKLQSVNLVDAAVALGNVDILMQHDGRLEKISMIKQLLPRIRSFKKDFKDKIEKRLCDSLENMRQSDTFDTLELLQYMGLLKPSVQAFVNNSIQSLETECMDAITQETCRSTAEESNYRKADISILTQGMFDVLRSKATRIWHLQRTLGTILDRQTRLFHIDLVTERDEPSLFSTFWEVSCAIIRDIFVQAKEYDPSIWDAFITKYPLIRGQANALLQDLQLLTSASCGAIDYKRPVTQTLSAGICADEKSISAAQNNQFIETLTGIHESFLDRILQRMMKLVAMMFPKDADFHASPPTRNDLQQLIRAIDTEFELVSQDLMLRECVSSQIENVVQVFCENVSRISMKEKSAVGMRQDLGRSSEQAHNVSLISLLLQLDTAMQSLKSKAQTISSNANSKNEMLSLSKSQSYLRDLASRMLEQYLASLIIFLKYILEKMQHESFDDVNGTSDHGDKEYSDSMILFGEKFKAIQREHLRRLPKHELVHTKSNQIATELLSFFIRQASTLRPLSGGGKVRLANDMALFEMDLANIAKLKELGASYEELGAFRHMLYLDSESILRDSRIDKIRPSNVLHHLITRAPKELQLPHERRGCSVSEYIEWLETSEMPSTIQENDRTRERKLKLSIEEKAWKEIVICLQSHTDRIDEAAEKEIVSVCDAVMRAGPILMAGYEITIMGGSTSDQDT